VEKTIFCQHRNAGLLSVKGARERTRRRKKELGTKKRGGGHLGCVKRRNFMLENLMGKNEYCVGGEEKRAPGKREGGWKRAYRIALKSRCNQIIPGGSQGEIPEKVGKKSSVKTRPERVYS